MVRRADGSVAARPELVKDADGLTEFQRRFVELVIGGDPETGEALIPAQAWVKAGGGQSCPTQDAGKLLLDPSVQAALMRGGAAFVWQRGLVGKVAELIELVMSREIRLLRAAEANKTAYQPSRVAQAYAAVVVGLAGIKAPEKVEVTHDVSQGLIDRLESARRRAERRGDEPRTIDGEALPATAGEAS